MVVHTAASEGTTDPANMQVARVGDVEDSTLKDQLSKAWKRIADLETRVHDLTLQSTLVSVLYTVCMYIYTCVYYILEALCTFSCTHTVY